MFYYSIGQKMVPVLLLVLSKAYGFKAGMFTPTKPQTQTYRAKRLQVHKDHH